VRLPSDATLSRKTAYLIASGSVCFLFCHCMSLMAQRGQLPAGPLLWGGRIELGCVLNRGLLGGLVPYESGLVSFAIWSVLGVMGSFAFGLYFKHARARIDWMLLGFVVGAGAATIVDRLCLGGVSDYFLLRILTAKPALAFNLPDLVLPPVVFYLTCRMVSQSREAPASSAIVELPT
jgi:lipoprotein signal peptidase